MHLASLLLMAVLGAGPGDVAAAGLQPTDCPVDVSWTTDTVDCFTATVPLDHDDPGRGEIDLAVLVLRSYAFEPEPDPVVYLEGGPGGSPIAYFDTWTFSRILDSRDLILVDPRGTGFSSPALNCPEALSVFDPVEAIGAYDSCRERYEVEGYDLALFNSVQSAQDLEAIRMALEIDKWNLYGISYGTRVALTAMRLHPESIRSVVLDSAVPVDADLLGTTLTARERALDALVAECASREECSGRFGDLEQKIDEVKQRLGDDGVAVDIPWLDGTDTSYTEVVTASDFEYGVGVAMYDSSLIPILPWLVARVASGDDEPLSTLMAFAWFPPPPESQSDGAFFATLCVEEFPFASEPSRAAERADAADLGFAAAADVYNRWRLTPADDVENLPVASDIPTLVLAGAFDPATPPEWGAQAAGPLSEAQTITIAGGGHAVSVVGCGEQLVVDFLANPGAEVDGECADEPLEIRRGGVPVALIDLFNGNDNEFAGALVALLAWIGAAVFGVAMWRWRIGGGFHHVAWLLVMMAMGFHFLAVTLYSLVRLGSFDSAPVFLQPAWTWPLFAIPYVALVGVGVASVGTVVAVVRSKTPAWAILPYMVLGASVVVMVIGVGIAGFLPWL